MNIDDFPDWHLELGQIFNVAFNYDTSAYMLIDSQIAECIV